MTLPRIMIAGIGNIFFGDDAFGSEVAQRMSLRTISPDVQVIDFGIRSIDLTYALLDGYQIVILVDAVNRGEAPGTLFVIEPDIAVQPTSESFGPLTDMHNLNPAAVLGLARALGSCTERLVLVGCQPAEVVNEDYQPAGLTPAVEAAVEPAITMIETMIDQFRIGSSPISGNHCMVHQNEILEETD